MAIPDTSILRGPVEVGVTPGLPLLTIDRGTVASDIPADQLAQLCEEHFADVP